MNSLMRNLALCLLVLSTSGLAKARMGGGDPGGGDQYTLDFINTAQNEIYPWLKKHGTELNPPINAEEFLKFVNPKKIVSQPAVFESCNKSGKPESENDRSVSACYSATTGMTRINQSTYPLDVVASPMKRNFIMHEVFRKMGIEGDDYKVTKRISQTQIDPEEFQNCVIHIFQKFTISQETAIDSCLRSGGDEAFQSCAVNLYKKIHISPDDAIEKCLATNAAEKFQNCAINLNRNLIIGPYDAMKACEENGSDEQLQSCAIKLSNNIVILADDAISACKENGSNKNFQSCVLKFAHQMGFTPTNAIRACKWN